VVTNWLHSLSGQARRKLRVEGSCAPKQCIVKYASLLHMGAVLQRVSTSQQTSSDSWCWLFRCRKHRIHFLLSTSTQYSIVEIAGFTARYEYPLPFFAGRKSGFVFQVPSMSPYFLRCRDGSRQCRGFANEAMPSTLAGVA
jgi:hypothetical protein